MYGTGQLSRQTHKEKERERRRERESEREREGERVRESWREVGVTERMRAAER